MATKLSVSLLLIALTGCAPELVSRPNDAGPLVDQGALQPDLGAPSDTAEAADRGASADAGAGPDVTPSVDAPVSADSPAGDDLGAPARDAGFEADAGQAPADTGPVGVDTAVEPSTPPLPATPGPHRVAVWTGAVSGSSGNARVFYPMGASGRDAFPLVVFAHGFQLGVNNYDGLLTHVASHGYVVASVDYPGSLLRVDHREVSTALRNVRRAFAMQSVPGFPALAQVDASRAAAMGHSLGGKGAVMAVLDDPTAFVAAVALDPVDDNPAPGGSVSETAPSVAPERMGALRTPLALFGSSQGRCTTLGTSCAPESSNYLRFAAAAPSMTPSALYPLLNFGHNDFVDSNCGFQCNLCARGAAPLDSRVAALRGLSVAFLQRFARGDLRYQPFIDGEGRAALVRANTLWNGVASALPACR